jgi:hypothetical protein
MVGLKGLLSTDTGLPQREDIEKWWVEGMNDSAKWHSGSTSTGVKLWNWPIDGIE